MKFDIFINTPVLFWKAKWSHQHSNKWYFRCQTLVLLLDKRDRSIISNNKSISQPFQFYNSEYLQWNIWNVNSLEQRLNFFTIYVHKRRCSCFRGLYSIYKKQCHRDILFPSDISHLRGFLNWGLYPITFSTIPTIRLISPKIIFKS